MKFFYLQFCHTSSVSIQYPEPYLLWTQEYSRNPKCWRSLSHLNRECWRGPSFPSPVLSFFSPGSVEGTRGFTQDQDVLWVIDRRLLASLLSESYLFHTRWASWQSRYLVATNRYVEQIFNKTQCSSMHHLNQNRISWKLTRFGLLEHGWITSE